MKMDSGIVLSAQTPSVLNALASGTQFAAQQAQVKHQNAIADVYSQHGAGIAAGDPTAINALAALDPQAAQSAHMNVLNMQAAEQQMQMARQKAVSAARAEAAKISQTEALESAKRIERAVQGASHARTPQEWDSFVQQAGVPDLVGRFGERHMVIGTYSGIAEGLKTADRYKVVGNTLFDLGAEGGPTPVGAAEKKPSAVEAEIERLESIGMDRDTAIKITSGVLAVSRDPVTGESQIVDRATGQVVGAQNSQPVQTPELEPTLSFGQQYPDAGRSFGVEGAVRGFANTVGDAFGAGAPFPEVQSTQADFAVLSEKLVNDVASGYARQPPSWLLKNIAELSPRAGRVFEGQGEAQAKLDAIGRDLQSEMQSAKRQLNNRALDPKTKIELEGTVAALQSALARVETARAAFQASAGSQDDVDLMNELLGE